jgi:hypothetical protein
MRLKSTTLGVSVVRWLNVETPQVLSSRADLLGATSEGEFVHIELQSTNDPDMALRMAEEPARRAAAANSRIG